MGYMDRLAQLRKALERSREISTELENMRPYREALEKKVKALKKSLNKENQDVEDLEASKVVSLVLSLRGKLDDRMEKEKAEALAVKLKFEQSQNELSELDGRITALQEEQAGLESCRPEYEQLFEEKRQRLMREDNNSSQRIAELSENLARTESLSRESSGVLKTGEKMLKLLDLIMDDLKKADAFDSDYCAHNLDYSRRDYLDRAAECAGKAQQLFNRFKSAAANLSIMNEASVTTGFLVVDILFDDLIANWYELDRIGKSQTNVDTVRCEIYCDVLKLKQLSEETQRRLSGMTSLLDELVLSVAE